MSINFELLDLRAFLAVFDYGSFHKAAGLLNLSQPALSRRIQCLEVKLGTPLLERSTRHVSPTAAGCKLEPMARRLVEELEASLLTISGTDERQSGQVTIGAIPSAVVSLLPAIMRHFHERFPRMRLRVMDRTPQEALSSVIRGDVEFGINMVGASMDDVTFTPLVEDPYVLVCLRESALAKRRNLRWVDLTGHSLIRVGRVNSGNRVLLDNTLADAGVQLDWFYEVNNLDSALRLVEEGLGASVLPAMALEASKHPSLVMKQVGAPGVSRTIGIVERRKGRLSPPAQYLKDMLLMARAQKASRGAKRPRDAKV
jgi:DNA-binding transcriptional LysR family regulator